MMTTTGGVLVPLGTCTTALREVPFTLKLSVTVWAKVVAARARVTRNGEKRLRRSMDASLHRTGDWVDRTSREGEATPERLESLSDRTSRT
jgi:hypothetical protein